MGAENRGTAEQWLEQDEPEFRQHRGRAPISSRRTGRTGALQQEPQGLIEFLSVGRFIDTTNIAQRGRNDTDSSGYNHLTIGNLRVDGCINDSH